MEKPKSFTFKGDKVNLNDTTYSQVSYIIIDMTNWKTLDTSAQRNGQFPYTMMFIDADKKLSSAYATDMKSSGLDNMLREGAKKYGIVVTDNTKVQIICPKDMVETDVGFGTSYEKPISEFRKKGMGALPFPVTNEGHVRDRLESVLDSAVHHACETYIDTPLARGENGVFKNSVYHYERADAAHAEFVKNYPEKDVREFNAVFNVDIS